MTRQNLTATQSYFNIMVSKHQFCRSEMLLGEKMEKLYNAHVAVFGLGGVGSYTVEALARAGVGRLTIVDDDVVAESNLNRQLYALHTTVGMLKVQVAAARIADINPDCEVDARVVRFDKTTAETFDFAAFDYVVDAIDTVTSKLLLIELCVGCGTPIISCMGTGNKLHAELLRVADISKTDVCPLAKVMRHELKKRGITRGVKAVYSPEPPLTPKQLETTSKRQTPGSVSFVPSVAGLLIAGEAVRDLTNF